MSDVTSESHPSLSATDGPERRTYVGPGRRAEACRPWRSAPIRQILTVAEVGQRHPVCSSRRESSRLSLRSSNQTRIRLTSIIAFRSPCNSQPNSRKNSLAPAGLSRPPTLVDPLEPFRKEVNRITSTFLRPGSSKELNLDERSRDRVLFNLTESVHPDGCLPAYEEAWMSLQNSMDHFLTVATENTPRRRQFWCVGSYC